MIAKIRRGSMNAEGDLKKLTKLKMKKLWWIIFTCLRIEDNTPPPLWAATVVAPMLLSLFLFCLTRSGLIALISWGVGVIVVICFYRYLMLPKTWAGILDRQLLEYIEKYNGRDNEDFFTGTNDVPLENLINDGEASVNNIKHWCHDERWDLRMRMLNEVGIKPEQKADVVVNLKSFSGTKD